VADDLEAKGRGHPDVARGIDGDAAAVFAARFEFAQDGAVGVPQEVDPVRVDLVEDPEPLRTILQAIGLLPRRLPQGANVVGHGRFLRRNGCWEYCAGGTPRQGEEVLALKGPAQDRGLKPGTGTARPSRASARGPALGFQVDVPVVRSAWWTSRER